MHYEKHVRSQGEWQMEEMPSTTAYVAYAADTLDSLADVFEMWQPSNRAVVKYDAGEDVLAIGDLHRGDLHTCFRPGGAEYVIRKLTAGHWIPPPVRGAVPYSATEVHDELAGLLGELERAVTVADSDAHAVAAGEAGRILAAIASQERAEFLLWLVRTRYLTRADEALLDSLDLELAAAQAAFDIALEVWQASDEDALTRAVEVSVARYLADTLVAIENGDEEDLDDLLGLRDRIELARMSARGRGRLAGLVDDEAFRSSELAALDALVAICRRGTEKVAPQGGWPETFVWRGAEKGQ